MQVPTRQTFQIALSPEHLQLVLNGLSELPYKESNGLIKYLQQQVATQLADARSAATPSPANGEAETEKIKAEDPKLAAAIEKAE